MRLDTLGGLSLEGVRFPHRKALLVLAYLSLEGPQERRRLAALFWPSAADPLNQLAVNLTRLRRGAPGAVGADRHRAWSLVRTDVDDVLDMLAAGDADAARAAHGAPFLRGVQPRNVNEEVHEWIFATAERLVSAIRSASIDVAEGLAAEGAFREAASRAEEAWLLQGTAVPDPTMVQRMHTLLLAGPSPRRLEVRREAQDLGVELVDSVEGARAALRGRRSSAAPRTNLPHRTASFVGRDRERRELRERLLSRDHRLVTIVGSGGSGKSRLAEQVGLELLATGELEGGVQLVELEAGPRRTAWRRRSPRAWARRSALRTVSWTS